MGDSLSPGGGGGQGHGSNEGAVAGPAAASADFGRGAETGL